MSQQDLERSGVSIVVPAFNEAGAIEVMLQGLQKTLATLGRPNEIIVIDDGSSDGTGLLAEKQGVRVLRHPLNAGYGRAILSGIDHSTYSTIAVIDADGSYPVDRLPDLLKMYEQGFDMVVGARQGSHYYSSTLKRLLRAIFKFLAEFSTGRSIPDVNSGMRVFRKAPVLAYRTSISTGFSFTTTVTLLFTLSGLFVGYLPITYQKRIGSSKVHLARDGLRSLQIIFSAIARFNPLKLYLLLIMADAAITGLFALGTSPSFLLIDCFFFLGSQGICLIAALAILTISLNQPAVVAPSRQP